MLYWLWLLLPFAICDPDFYLFATTDNLSHVDTPWVFCSLKYKFIISEVYRFIIYEINQVQMSSTLLSVFRWDLSPCYFPSSTVLISPFHATGLFLKPLKKSGNLWVAFKRYRKRLVAKKVKKMNTTIPVKKKHFLQITHANNWC